MGRSTERLMNTVETPVSDNPKCQAEVVAHGRWSHTRDQTKGGQNFDFDPRVIFFNPCKNNYITQNEV